MNFTATCARFVHVGDVLTDSEGRYTRVVVEVDALSHRQGKIILRTANRPGGKATGSTVVEPYGLVNVVD